MKNSLFHPQHAMLFVCIFITSVLHAQVNQGSSNQSGTYSQSRVASNVPDPITIFKGTNTSSAPASNVSRETFPYISFPGDPTNTRIYKLKNGMVVYLSDNKAEPRLQTYIAVNTGSNNDPKETTGLAHYLEHMMFKGTSRIGTTNWVRERPVIDSMEQLYELYRNTSDPVQKKQIYAKIDKLSQQDNQYAVPNEYDKMVSSLGAQGTNAYTSKEQTVFVNDIPSNELEKWLVIESERFRECVLRLFPTELEAVYEEYNMNQDRDNTKVYETLYRALFPVSPYGQQTTIGTSEDLKNPSMLNIIRYFNTYYVPSNMAICISGDLDYDNTIALIDKYFGGFMTHSAMPDKKMPADPPLSEIQHRDVYGNESESVRIGYRFPGANSRDQLIADLVADMLYNGHAGLLDIDLDLSQKVLSASAYSTDWRDYTVLTLSAKPLEGQSLENCEQLLEQEIGKLKSGDFDDWLIKACIDDMRIGQMHSFETNRGRASAFVDSYIRGINWKNYFNMYNLMEGISKQDIIAFANTYFGNNYAVVYKHQGEDKNVSHVEKPDITPLDARRDAESDFLHDFMELPDRNPAEPAFINYTEQIKSSALSNGVPFYFLQNSENPLFELYYVFYMGSDNDPDLSLAVNYLPYLGTAQFTPAQLRQEFFRYGLTFNVYTSHDRTYVSLSGPQNNYAKGLQLFEGLLAGATPDKEAYDELVSSILKERSDNKSNKNVIFNSAMYNFARYGASSPFTNILSADDLKKTDPVTLIEKIKSLESYPHEIFYYGQGAPDDIKKQLEAFHKTPPSPKPYPAPKHFTELPTRQTQVYFVNYNMRQAQIMFLSKDSIFDKSLYPAATLFNAYFGSGLSSIVFQEIRETRALAYSAYAAYTIPQNRDESHYVRAYVATQADKVPQAVNAMLQVLNSMPQAQEQFDNSVESVEKQIRSDRILRTDIFWNYENAKRLGLSYDIRRDVYQDVPSMTMDDLQDFFDKHIAGRPYTILVLGDRNSIDMNYLKSLGTFRELSLPEIFGY